MPFGMSPWSLLIILAIVVVIFGTKRLRNMGGDLGGALKNFRTAVKDSEDEKPESPRAIDPNTIKRDKPEVEGTITNTKYDNSRSE